jgi:predicted transcriptional regulator
MATSLKIDPALKERVQNLAARQHRSPHWIMLRAIEQYVARQEARDSFRKEASASWTAYQETGRHLTGAEVRDWLSKWGTSAETELPECHD